MTTTLNGDRAAAFADLFVDVPSAPDVLVRRLRDLIHRGELSPGDRFPPERELCEQLGMARLTLRQALSVLRAEGYVEVRRGPQGGTFVSTLDEPFRRWAKRLREQPKDLDDIIDMRVLIEGHAAARAAERRSQRQLTQLRVATAPPKRYTLGAFRAADSAFHRLIAAASRSERLCVVVDDLRSELFVPASEVLVTPESTTDSLREHADIYQAVADQDSAAAQALMADHIEGTRAFLKQALALA